MVVLVFGSAPLSCRRCALERRTGRTTEEHHLGGRPSPLVVEVDANQHAWASLYQVGWRRRLAPGSLSAVFADLVMLVGLRLQERWRGAAA